MTALVTVNISVYISTEIKVGGSNSTIEIFEIQHVVDVVTVAAVLGTEGLGIVISENAPQRRRRQ